MAAAEAAAEEEAAAPGRRAVAVGRLTLSGATRCPTAVSGPVLPDRGKSDCYAGDAQVARNVGKTSAAVASSCSRVAIRWVATKSSSSGSAGL